MRRTHLTSLLITAWACCLASPRYAQQRPLTPHIGYVFPAGGQQGTTFEVTAAGQLLFGAMGARVTGQGVEATFLSYDRPMTQRQALLLRDKLDEARKKLEAAGGPNPFVNPRGPLAIARLAKEAGVTEEELRKLAEFQRSRNDPKKPPNPQIEEKVTLRIKIDPNAAPGPRDLRLLTPGGATNPIRFVVGQLGERLETEPNDKAAESGLGELPVTINGQIQPGDVDRFTFTARKDAQLVIAVSARDLVPYLADAVPGWFQPTVALYDAKGREVGYADDDRFRPDPALCCRIPDEGQYTVEIKDSIYRGRDDFVYRMTVGEVPYVTGIFPLGGREKTATRVRLSGWNLSRYETTVEDAAGIANVCGQRADIQSNAEPFSIDELPEQLEKEPNNTTGQAQQAEGALIVNGRIDRPGDVDVFKINGRAGEELVAEVRARRLGSPLDSILRIMDAKGKQIAVNDDAEDRGAGLLPHAADSYVSVKLPSNGAYFVSIGDSQRQGGPEFAYRLRISPPRPDFELRIVPSALRAAAGAAVPFTVQAIRRDGYKGAISLELVDAPAGFTVKGGIPDGQDTAKVMLQTPAVGRPEPFSLKLRGKATTPGGEIARTAVPAEDMMQAFAYHHLVPADEWLVTVIGRARPGPFLRTAPARPR